MIVRRLVLGPLDTNCWIVCDDAGGPAVVIDPADDAASILEVLAGREIAAVVLTHNHFDHIGAVSELIELTGAPLVVHAADAAGLTDAQGTGGAQFGFSVTTPSPDRLLMDGDRIDAGDVRLHVLHTPGHTPGGICLLASDSAGGPSELFSGDTVFAGSVGRSDLTGGDARELSRSIAARLAPLPAETLVHPGHGADTSIGRERLLNPFFPRA